MPPQARRKTAGKAKNADAPGLQIVLDGRTHTVRESDLTPHDVRALRKEVGFSWAGLSRELQRDPDIDLIAALVWLARRIDGDEVPYDQVLDEIGYDSELDVKLEDKRTPAKTLEAVESSPEASGVG